MSEHQKGNVHGSVILTSPILKRSLMSDLEKQNPDVDLAEGSVVLGRQSKTGNTYVTRYRIDHAQKRHHVTRNILGDECVPCCYDKEKTTARGCIWNCIRSEAFLFGLHMTALVVGVVKAAANVRQISENLELAHSLLETVSALLLVIVRLVVAWVSFKEVKVTAYENEHVPVTSGSRVVRGRALQRYLYGLTVVAALLITAGVVCFLCFYYIVHLGWTILSNNFVMVVMGEVSGLFMIRIDRATSRIRDDQQKTVLYEAGLLLHDTIQATSDQQEATKLKVIRFLRAIQDTDFLTQPDHITVEKECEDNLNMLLTMEMQAMA